MIVRNADVDGDGVVTLEDFRTLVATQQKGLEQQVIVPTDSDPK
jgi:Ca2+-binding EF-hand superfamily protein